MYLSTLLLMGLDEGLIGFGRRIYLPSVCRYCEKIDTSGPMSVCFGMFASCWPSKMSFSRSSSTATLVKLKLLGVIAIRESYA
jgi:hypothetical protein